MNDIDIVKLYFERDDRAILETEKSYGSFLTAIALRILGDRLDSEECVSDTYLRAWNSMPPQKPSKLSAFLGRITRNLSFDRYRIKNAEKRGGAETEIILDELSEITDGKDSTYGEVERMELVKTLNSFLASLDADKRSIFVLRYWYSYSVSDIALKCGKSESNISVILSRTRNALRIYLSERGFEI
ncbi:MAG: sigma-70 family RNA polymerase sigma factor [Clostridia bacterium]|nr:sigma-70 family RNA polymerase sigma factor [Clostridia bacterium]